MKKHQKGQKFTQLLMLWHEKDNKREMPWKGERDTYKIWLSEIILQQTRVEQGTAYYNRFVAKYPNVGALAGAEDLEVFKLWEGLGYYNRCKNLLTAARFVHSQLKGVFPSTYEGILQLKGVGPYTASAIASFAYNLPTAVVDGNVYRVLARYFGISTAVDSNAGKSQFTELAYFVLDTHNSALYNQAIMDFGATICKPKVPLCSVCSLKEDCVAFRKNRVAELPVKEKKLLKKERWFNYVLAERDNMFLVNKRMGKDIWQNLHEFLLMETLEPVTTEYVLATKEVMALHLKKFSIKNVRANMRQQLTHQTIYATFIYLQCNSLSVPRGMEMVEKEHMEKLAFPRLINHYLEWMRKDWPVSDESQ